MEGSAGRAHSIRRRDPRADRPLTWIRVALAAADRVGWRVRPDSRAVIRIALNKPRHLQAGLISALDLPTGRCKEERWLVANVALEITTGRRARRLGAAVSADLPVTTSRPARMPDVVAPVEVTSTTSGPAPSGSPSSSRRRGLADGDQERGRCITQPAPSSQRRSKPPEAPP